MTGEFRPGRQRPGVVRRRGAALDPPAQPGQAPPGGRAGARSAPWPGSPRRGRASAGGCAAPTACWRSSSSSPEPSCRRARWSRWCCPTRVRDYSPAMLDELTSAGEVLWAGAGGLPGGDGWISLVPADLAPLLLPEPLEVPGASGAPILEQLAGGQALFFRGAVRPGRRDRRHRAGRPRLGPGLGRRADQRHPRAAADPARRRRHAQAQPDRSPAARASTADGTAAPGSAGRRCRRAPGRRRWPAAGPGCPTARPTATRRTTARAEALIERHGVLTRGAVMAEQVAGGFSAVYPVLRAFEENGRARRGYFVETLGAAQFGTPGSVDRLRSFAAPDRVPGGAVVLAATDPANVYGAALPWPDRPAAGRPGRGRPGRGHRPARKADRAPRGPQGRRAGGAGRRRAGPLRRAGRQDAAVLDRGRAGAQGGGDGAVRRGRRPGRSGGWWCRRPTASPCTSRPRCRRRCRPPGSPRPREGSACAPDRAGRLTDRRPRAAGRRHARGVGLDAVGRQQPALPAGPVVPAGAPGRDGEVGPAVGHAQRAEVDVPRPAAVVLDQRVGAQASPWQTTSRSTSGTSASRARTSGTVSAACSGQNRSRRTDAGRTSATRAPADQSRGSRPPAGRRAARADPRRARPRPAGIGQPPGVDGAPPGQAVGEQPRADVVRVVLQDDRDRREPGSPAQPHHLAGEVEPAAGRRPLHELPAAGRHRLPGEAAELVAPDRRQPRGPGKDGDGGRHRHGPVRRPRDHPGDAATETRSRAADRRRSEPQRIMVACPKETPSGWPPSG